MLHTLFQNLRKWRLSKTVPLGRWCRTEKTLNDIKVDLANVDHCGTCLHNKLVETNVFEKRPVQKKQAISNTSKTGLQ